MSPIAIPSIVGGTPHGGFVPGTVKGGLRGRMKNGPYPRFSACTSRRCLSGHGSVMAAAGRDPGVLKSGPDWRISMWAIRRFLLRDGVVMAAAGTDPPWPPLPKGGKGKGSPLLKGGKGKGSPLLKGGKERGAPFQRGGKERGAPFQRGGSSAQHSRGEIPTPWIGSFQQPRACRFGGIVPGEWGPYDIRWPRSTGMSLIGRARAYGHCPIARTQMPRVSAHTP